MTRFDMLLLVCFAVAISGCDPQAVPKLPAEGPELKVGEKRAASADDGKEPKTRIVRTLIDAIDNLDDKVDDDFDSDENNDVKKELRRTLREADKELRNVLGENSKRKIMEANKKPLIPVIGEPTVPPAIKKPEDKDKPKEQDEAKDKDKPTDKDAPQDEGKAKEVTTPSPTVPAAKSE